MKYILKEDFPAWGFKKGDVLYSFKGYDYGMASDDTRITGIEHISVTKDENGKPPSYTIPRYLLEIADGILPKP